MTYNYIKHNLLNRTLVEITLKKILVSIKNLKKEFIKIITSKNFNQ